MRSKHIKKLDFWTDYMSCEVELFIREKSEWWPFLALWDPLPLSPLAATILCCSCHQCKQRDR